MCVSDFDTPEMFPYETTSGGLASKPMMNESLRMKLYGWLIKRMYAPHMDDIGEAPPGYGPDASKSLMRPGLADSCGDTPSWPAYRERSGNRS
jgi:hypothetical protein